MILINPSPTIELLLCRTCMSNLEDLNNNKASNEVVDIVVSLKSMVYFCFQTFQWSRKQC